MANLQSSGKPAGNPYKEFLKREWDHDYISGSWNKQGKTHIHISRLDKFLYGCNDFIKNLYRNLMLSVLKISLRK